MHPPIFTVLMHVCVVSSPTASSGARRSEVHSVVSPDATHRLSVASVSPTSIRFAGRRETETLYRGMGFSARPLSGIGTRCRVSHSIFRTIRNRQRTATTTRQHDCRLALRCRRPWRRSQPRPGQDPGRAASLHRVPRHSGQLCTYEISSTRSATSAARLPSFELSTRPESSLSAATAP